MVDLIKKNLLKFIHNFIPKVMHQTMPSKTNVFLRFLEISVFIFRYAFETFDTNNDGTVSFEEFLLSVSATSKGDLEERLSYAFDL